MGKAPLASSKLCLRQQLAALWPTVRNLQYHGSHNLALPRHKAPLAAFSDASIRAHFFWTAGVAHASEQDEQDDSHIAVAMEVDERTEAAPAQPLRLRFKLQGSKLL